VTRTASLALVLAAAFAGCQNGPSSDGSGGPRGTSSIDPQMTVGPPPSPTPDADTPAVLDATLLGHLPEAVAGAPVTEELNEAALALADPELSEIATALDVGVALDQSTGNLVTAHVVRLREGAFDDDTYRQWRDSYDEGACAAAGGILGRAEATIGERNVHVTSCVAGLRTYHVWIEDELLLISASSVGTGRFGELLMSELRVE
jgi:hypothetical protein